LPHRKGARLIGEIGKISGRNWWSRVRREPLTAMVEAKVLKLKTEFRFVDSLLNKQIFNCGHLSVEERSKRIDILSGYAYPDNVYIGQSSRKACAKKRRKRITLIEGEQQITIAERHNY
jgi:hypothetical protein